MYNITYYITIPSNTYSNLTTVTDQIQDFTTHFCTRVAWHPLNCSNDWNIYDLANNDIKKVHTLTNQIAYNTEETELDEVNKGYSPGWMLKKDPKLGQKIKDTKKAYKELKKEETDLEAQLSEVLDPSQGVKAYIDDFEKSDDPRFAGDSKEQRRKRAIAAFYAAKKK